MMLSMSHFVRAFIVIDIHFIRKKTLKQNQCIALARSNKVVLDSVVVFSTPHTSSQL